MFRKKLKTANIQHNYARTWATALKEMQTPLKNCSDVAKEIKDLLKKYDQAKTYDKKSTFALYIIDKLKNIRTDALKLADNIETGFVTSVSEVDKINEYVWNMLEIPIKKS